MSKPSKKLIFGLSAFGILFVIIVVLLIPLGGRTLLARAFDGTGQHKLAMGTDLFFQGKANGLLQNLNVSDLSNPDQCANAYKILQNEKLNIFQGISGRNKTVIKPINNDKILLETNFAGSINPETKKASANLEIISKLDKATLDEILKEMKSESLSGVLPLETKIQASTFFDVNQFLFTINKFDFKTADLNSSNGLSNYYKADFVKTDTDKEKLRQEGISEIISEIKTQTNVKMSEIISEDTFKTLSNQACQTIQKTEVLAPIERDFGVGNVSVRPVVTTYKPNALEIQMENSTKQSEILEKDQKLKNFLYSKFSSFQKIAISLEKVTGEAAKDKNGKLIKNLTAEELKIYEEEYKKGVDQWLSSKDKDGKPKSDPAKVKEEMDRMYKYFIPYIDRTVTFINANTGDIYGSETAMYIQLTEETTKNLSGKLKEIVGNQIEITSTSFDTQYGNVKDLETPTNTKTIGEFTKDLLKTEGAKKIQDETQKLAPTPSDNMMSSTPNGSFGGSYGGNMSSPTSPNMPKVNSGFGVSTDSNFSSGFNFSSPSQDNPSNNFDFGN